MSEEELLREDDEGTTSSLESPSAPAPPVGGLSDFIAPGAPVRTGLTPQMNRLRVNSNPSPVHEKGSSISAGESGYVEEDVEEDAGEDAEDDLFRLFDELIAYAPTDRQSIFRERFNNLMNSRERKADNKKKKKKRQVNFQVRDFLLKEEKRCAIDVIHMDLAEGINGKLKKIEEIMDNIKKTRSHLLYNFIHIGKLIYELKELKTANLYPRLRKRGITYATSHCNFLVQLYKYASEYPKVQYLAISLNMFKIHFKLIREQIAVEPEFWKNLS